MDKKLLGGFDTKYQFCRIYDLDGELVMADGREASCEIIEALAIYMTVPWDIYKSFRFFRHNGGFYCECVVECKTFEAFVCGYGATEGEAFKDCTTRLYDWIERYTNLGESF